MGKQLVLYSSIWTTILMLVLFLFSSWTGSSTPNSVWSDLPGGVISSGSRHLQGKVIVLDPGHGGGDPGTVGVGSSTEAENVLAIAWELRNMLEKAGAEVIMTRQTDQNPALGTTFGSDQNAQLAARVGTANRSKGQIFISLHNDWNDNSAIRGSSTYYYKSQDLALAEKLQKAMVQHLKTVDLGVKRGNLYVLRNTNIPAALVEIGFLSNFQEATQLAKPSYRVQAARALYTGISQYFQGQF